MDVALYGRVQCGLGTEGGRYGVCEDAASPAQRVRTTRHMKTREEAAYLCTVNNGWSELSQLSMSAVARQLGLAALAGVIPSATATVTGLGGATAPATMRSSAVAVARERPLEAGKGADLQVAGDRCARRDLRRLLGRAVLVRLAEPGAVHEPERFGVVEERVEDRAGVEDGHLPEVPVLGLEGADVRGELRVVVRKGRGDQCDGVRALLDDQRGAVCRRYGQE